MPCQEHRKWTYRVVSGDYCLTRAAGLKGLGIETTGCGVIGTASLFRL